MNRRYFARRGGGSRWRQRPPPSETSVETTEETQVATITTQRRRFTARRGGGNRRHHLRAERSRETNAERKPPQPSPAPPPPPEESESDRNKREADVRVSARFVRRFTRECHSGRVPPDPSVLPPEFECIHCHKVVKREENTHPWRPPALKKLPIEAAKPQNKREHEGVLRNPGLVILKAPRFSAGEYEPCGDDDCYNDGDDDGGGGAAATGKVWSCCGRGEYEEPRQDWWNVRFSRGDPRWREGVRDPPPHDCEPTYHEDVAGAAGWHGWRRKKDGVISKDPWRI
ncbi:hypothetical protein CIB48_g6672 [Xylaria polymorpha]|nr:hypothetical protein CIB48_g6672 [Xylaria polymorpha]